MTCSERRVLDQDDRPVARLATPAVDGLVQLRLVDAGGDRQDVQRLVEVLGLLADERDVEGVPVLDEDLAVAIEQHAARRRQRQPPHVIVLRHLGELLALGTWKIQKPTASRMNAPATTTGGRSGVSSVGDDRQEELELSWPTSQNLSGFGARRSALEERRT